MTGKKGTKTIVTRKRRDYYKMLCLFIFCNYSWLQWSGKKFTLDPVEFRRVFSLPYGVFHDWLEWAEEEGYFSEVLFVKGIKSSSKLEGVLKTPTFMKEQED